MAAMSMAELDRVERSLGVVLPGLYVRLLTEIGFGRLGESAELYHPMQIRNLYEPFFDDPAVLFHPYFPFGCHNGKQEVWVIDAATERAAAIWHETVSDDWAEVEWLDYTDWVKRHLEMAVED